jgi:CBS domain-containing protein
MRSADTVFIAKTTERLEDLIPKLNKVSGLPVVDVNNRVIGVISRKVCYGMYISNARLQRIV